MKEERIVRRSLASLRESPRTEDWPGFDAITDEDIEAAVRADPDAAPIADRDWFREARLVMPAAEPPKPERARRD
jgi:ketosteroid isomerase-like protein